MWYIFLRSYSDTHLLTSPTYNDRICELINRLVHEQVEFAFYAIGSNFVNISRYIEPIQDFLRERKHWYDEDEEEYTLIRDLEKELDL